MNQYVRAHMQKGRVRDGLAVRSTPASGVGLRRAVLGEK